MALLAAASGALALSLGPSRGAVVLGSPIDLAFEVRPDPGVDLASSCVSARLVSGSTPIAQSRVHVMPMEGGPTPMVRVQASVAADEPVLTATLTAGCAGQVSRTYTFLADLPHAAPVAPAAARQPIDIARLGSVVSGAAPVAPARSAAAVVSPDRPPRAAQRAAPATPTEARQPKARQPQPPRKQTAKPAAAAPAKTPAPAAAVNTAATPAPAPSRLVMEPLDLWPDTPPSLRLSREQPTLTVPGDAQQRSESAALWHALNTSPAEVQQVEARLNKLEADAAAQRAQVEAERKVSAELRERLAQVESQGFSATVVYVLAALLLLALGAIAWLLHRVRSDAQQAWRQSVAASEGVDGMVLAEGPNGEPVWQAAPQEEDFWKVSTQWPADGAAASGPAPTVAASAAEPAAASAAPVPTAPVPVPTPVPAMPEAPAPQAAVAARQKIVGPEELFDTLQQADFYISVGEHEQAIDVLRAHIAQHGDASPQAYLELLRLYRTLGRAESFNQLSEQFQQRFNVLVPEFARFHQRGLVLEDYPDALARIEAEWSSSQVLDVLNELLFQRGDEDPTAGPFDLAAFSDLLLLLSIAQTTPASARGASDQPRTRTTPMAVPAEVPQGQAPDMLALEALAGGLQLQPLGMPEAPAEVMADLDFSDPPHITLSDLPPLLSTPAPAADQPVGFGLSDDKMEVRLELEQMDKKRRTDLE